MIIGPRPKEGGALGPGSGQAENQPHVLRVIPFLKVFKNPSASFLDNRLRLSKSWLAPLLLCWALPLLAAQPPRQVVFPPITAYSLDKQKITLPDGLAGQTDLLVISFEPEQRKDVESWLPAAQALQHTNFQFRYYQVPVSGRENILFRWWETSSLRSDETDPESWPWIVPIFVDRQKFLQDLQIPDEKQVMVLLVDRQGHLLWRATGAMTQEKRASLMAAVGSR